MFGQGFNGQNSHSGGQDVTYDVYVGNIPLNNFTEVWITQMLFIRYFLYFKCVSQWYLAKIILRPLFGVGQKGFLFTMNYLG